MAQWLGMPPLTQRGQGSNPSHPFLGTSVFVLLALSLPSSFSISIYILLSLSHSAPTCCLFGVVFFHILKHSSRTNSIVFFPFFFFSFFFPPQNPPTCSFFFQNFKLKPSGKVHPFIKGWPQFAVAYHQRLQCSAFVLMCANVWKEEGGHHSLLHQLIS